MNNFKVEIKEKDEWNEVTAVFPYISGDLLDERLDDRIVRIFKKAKHAYRLASFDYH